MRTRNIQCALRAAAARCALCSWEAWMNTRKIRRTLQAAAAAAAAGEGRRLQAVNNSIQTSRLMLLMLWLNALCMPGVSTPQGINQ
eukprot:1138987-Pelagomonas_calceolata.AAC.9